MLTFLSVLSMTCLLYLNVVKIRYSSPAISFTTVPPPPPPLPSHKIWRRHKDPGLRGYHLICYYFPPSQSLLSCPPSHSLLFSPHLICYCFTPTSFATVSPISFATVSPSISFATIPHLFRYCSPPPLSLLLPPPPSHWLLFSPQVDDYILSISSMNLRHILREGLPLVSIPLPVSQCRLRFQTSVNYRL